MPIIQVNLNSATTEELFERLAWFYATAHQVQIYDEEGYGHPISALVNLSRGKIPFPPRFALQNDLVQKQAYLQSLKVQNTCCTFEDWVKLGGFPKACLASVIVKGNGRFSAWKDRSSELTYQRF